MFGDECHCFSGPCITGERGMARLDFEESLIYRHLYPKSREKVMATALELSREGWKDYIEAARHKANRAGLSPAAQEVRGKLLDKAREAASLLKTRFGAKRVVLFGSLAHQAWFSPDTDMDLAVEGLQGNDYWDAWREVEDIVEDRSIDLIEIETARPSLLQAIQRHGVEL